MHPVYFEGAYEVGKPKDMTDEQCMSAWAQFGFGKLFQLGKIQQSESVIASIYSGEDANNYPFYMTAWQPNKEDLEALNAGRPVYVKVICKGLPPMALFTLDENNQPNF